MHPNAEELAEICRRAAHPGVLEKDFRQVVEAHLIALAVKLGIDLAAHSEHTLGESGRADTIYNRFIVEWKRPHSLQASNHATANQGAIAQAQRYGDSLHWATREKPGRIVCCCTDGCYFIFLTKPDRQWRASDPVAVAPQSCSRFLDYLASLQSGRALLPEYLCEDFSSASVETQRALQALYGSLVEHSEAAALQAVFDQWAQFFGAATDYEQWRVKLANAESLRRMVGTFGGRAEELDVNRVFFATHTFFAILTKLLAYIVVGRYTDLPSPPLAGWARMADADLARQFAELEKGGVFKAAGIRNYLEGDFFAWYAKFFTPGIGDSLRPILHRLSGYEPATLDLAPAATQDLLKKLYHRLVPSHIRKALGEYYTPDWLAQRLLNMLDGGNYRGNPDTRLLDCACGSGTFLVMAINAVRRNSVAQSMEEGALLRKICRNVVGIDLNPLAVVAARTNYLLALGPLLRHRGKEPLEIPVYLADSIMTPSRRSFDLFEQEKVRVWLSIGKLELPRRLATQEGVEVLTRILDDHLDRPTPTPTDKFLPSAKTPLVACGAKWDEDAEVVGALYAKLHELHAAGRNGLWARVLKNAFAPVFLAPFDFVAGNPPWVNWQNLPEGYRKETKNLWVQHGLFVAKGMDTILGKGKKDISMLMTYVAADSYLKDGGTLGFVITQSVFKTGGAGQGFRRFVTRQKKPLAVTWVDDFSELQLFEGATNRTAVFVMRKGQPTKYPVQMAYWRRAAGGRGGSFDYDATLDEVVGKTKRLQFVGEPVDPSDPTSAWLTGRRQAVEAVRKLLGKSDYRAHAGVNTGGANAVYWFEVLKEHGDGTVTARNMTEGAKRKVASAEVRLEKDLLYPLLRGRDVSRWRAAPSAQVLFVQDVKTRRGISETTMRRDHPHGYAWLESNKALLIQRAAYKRYFDPKDAAFYSMFNVGGYSVAEWKAVWSEQSQEVHCAVVGSVGGRLVLPDHKVMLVPCASRREAAYVAGVINSTLFRYAVRSYAIEIQMDTHLVENLRVPAYDARNELHKEIADLSLALAKADDEDRNPMQVELDARCARIWDLSVKEVKAVQSAYRELFATAASADHGGPGRVREDGDAYAEGCEETAEVQTDGSAEEPTRGAT